MSWETLSSSKGVKKKTNNKTIEKTEEAVKDGQCKDTGNIRCETQNEGQTKRK